MVVGIGTMTMRNRWIEGQIILDKPIKLKADIRGDYKNEHGENHICWRLVCDKSQFRLLGRHCRWSLKPGSRWKKKQKDSLFKKQKLWAKRRVGSEFLVARGHINFAPGFCSDRWHSRDILEVWIQLKSELLHLREEAGGWAFFFFFFCCPTISCFLSFLLR